MLYNCRVRINQIKTKIRPCQKLFNVARRNMKNTMSKFKWVRSYLVYDNERLKKIMQ